MDSDINEFTHVQYGLLRYTGNKVLMSLNLDYYDVELIGELN